MKNTGIILIISSDYDKSTGKVIDWLHSDKKNYILITETDDIVVTKLDICKIQDSTISINGESLVIGVSTSHF